MTNHRVPIIQRLRLLPLHQRYLLLWGGSCAVILLISWMWVVQLRVQLAALSPQTQVAASVLSTKKMAAQDKKEPNDWDQMISSVKDSVASIGSFFVKDASTKKETPPSTPARKEGSELNQFLDYQPFPDN